MNEIDTQKAVANLISPFLSTRFVDGAEWADQIESILVRYGISFIDTSNGVKVK